MIILTSKRWEMVHLLTCRGNYRLPVNPRQVAVPHTCTPTSMMLCPPPKTHLAVKGRSVRPPASREVHVRATTMQVIRIPAPNHNGVPLSTGTMNETLSGEIGAPL